MKIVRLETENQYSPPNSAYALKVRTDQPLELVVWNEVVKLFKESYKTEGLNDGGDFALFRQAAFEVIGREINRLVTEESKKIALNEPLMKLQARLDGIADWTTKNPIKFNFGKVKREEPL